MDSPHILLIYAGQVKVGANARYMNWIVSARIAVLSSQINTQRQDLKDFGYDFYLLQIGW
jgi:acyl-CoA thioesterase FadM